MPTDPLDDRIRSMMSDAMSSAPAAPSLSLRAPVRATPPRRGLLWAGIGVAACVAAVAVLVWTSGDDDHTVVGASTTDTPSTAPWFEWPGGVAALIASVRGIERVAVEDGHPSVTRVLDGVPVARAIELEDGGIVYQEMGGDIRFISPAGEVQETALVTDDGSGSTTLEDADAPNGNLRLVYRGLGTDPSGGLQLGVWFQPDEPRYSLLPGGFGVGYQRFTIVDDRSVISASVDDTGTRSSFAFDVVERSGSSGADEYVSPVAMAGDGAGTTVVLGDNGRIATYGARSGVTNDLGDAAGVSGLDLRGDWLAVQHDDGTSSVMDIGTGRDYPVPVAGIVTVSRRLHEVSRPAVAPWPSDVAVVVASERGIERVTSPGETPVVESIASPGPLVRAFEVADGSFVVDSASISADAPDIARVRRDGSSTTVAATALGATLQDVDPDGTVLLTTRTAEGVTSLSQVDPQGGIRQLRDDLPDARDISWGAQVIVGTQYFSGGSAPFALHRDGTALEAPPVALGELAAVDTTGTVFAWLASHTVIVEWTAPGNARNVPYGIPNTIGDVVGIEVTDGYLLLNGTDASALVELGRGTPYVLPVSGWATLSMAQPADTPIDVPRTTVLPEAWPAVVTAGPSGVWVYGPDGEVQWTAEPMAFAVKAPDGSMLMQRQSGGSPGSGWTQADTLPLRQASPGAPLEDLFGTLFPAADVVAGWYTLHDAATVGGRALVILDRQADLVSIDSPPGALLVLDLDAGSLAQIGEVGGWEAGMSRLHLAETGIIVGERYDGVTRSLFVQAIDNSPTFGVSDLGLLDSYSDCSDCPRLYTISRDGSTVAWLDGNRIERRSMFGDDIAMPAVELGDITGGGQLEATDLSISADVAVYDRNFVGAQSTPVLVRLDGDTPRSEGLGPAARTALP